jgi:predicted nucleic acid-binding protein
VTYWDSSAILKLYVTEPDSDYFMALAGAKHVRVHSSAILTVEALCAFSRKEQEGRITPHVAARVYQDLARHIEAGRIVLSPYGPGIVTEAHRVLTLIRQTKTPRVLRSLDLIHLASALEGKATSFVATDIRLREIAALAGLKVLP